MTGRTVSGSHRLVDRSIDWDLRGVLAASGAGTFAVSASTGEAMAEGYPHPLTGKTGRWVGDVDRLLAGAASGERERVRAAFARAFATGCEVGLHISVGERRVVVRGGTIDGGRTLTGLCLDVTREDDEDAARRRRVEQHRGALCALTRAVAEAGDDHAMALRLVTEAAATALDVEVAGVWLNEPERGAWACVDRYERTGARHSTGQTRPHDVDIGADPGATLDVPVRIAGRLRASVCLEHAGPPRTWSVEEQAFAASTADLVALVLDSRAPRCTTCSGRPTPTSTLEDGFVPS
jgi:hypothetical protein